MTTSPRTPRVLIVAGYFDWFSGYQETSLAGALARAADLTILAGDHASPIFSDAHLERVGAKRVYENGTTHEHGATMVRVPVKELRSMVWSNEAVRFVRQGKFDLVIQVMPGQILPLAGAAARGATRVALYGDNSAMYAALAPWKAKLKFLAFAASKGAIYALNNAGADRVFGYTPETLQRLRAFGAGKRYELLPLTVDSAKFFVSADLREQTRRELGIPDTTKLVIAPGKPQPQKRVDALIDALNDQSTEWKLLVVGSDDSATSRELKNKVEKLGLEDRVNFMPFVDAERLNALYNAADLGVWPTMPAITIQQGMTTGLPVLIPNNSFTSHLFTDGSGAIEVPSIEALPASLRQVVDTPGSGDDRAASAANNAWFTAENVAKQLLKSARCV